MSKGQSVQLALVQKAVQEQGHVPVRIENHTRRLSVMQHDRKKIATDDKEYNFCSAQIMSTVQKMF
jgi:hypothetical protein